MPVLCGTDFSVFAMDAATLAARWCHRSGAELHLVHVTTGEALTPLREQLEAEGNRLAALGATIGRLDIVLGQPADVLLEEAESRQAELIVLGAVGQRLRDRWLTGSVTTRVARDAGVPVLVAREIAALDAWLQSGKVLKILTGFERGASTRKALEWTAALTRLGPVELTVMQLVVPGPENQRAHATGEGAGLTLLTGVEDRLLTELRSSIEEVIGKVPVRPVVRIAQGRRDIHLVMEAQDFECGLLVVGSHQRHGFQRWWSGSVSHGVLNAATVSVAVVPSRSSAD